MVLYYRISEGDCPFYKPTLIFNLRALGSCAMSGQISAFFAGGLFGLWHRSAGNSFQLRLKGFFAVVGFKLASSFDEAP